MAWKALVVSTVAAAMAGVWIRNWVMAGISDALVRAFEQPARSNDG